MKRKKTILKIMITLLITCTVNVVSAAEIGFCKNDIEYNVMSSWMKGTKTTVGDQKLKMINAFTSLTNPCPNCTFIAKPYTPSGDFFTGITIKMNQTGTFPGDYGSAWPGEYILKGQRADFTLLKSTVEALWYLD